MRLPRDMSGEDLAAVLRRHYGYRLVRQKGSHMTLNGGLPAIGPFRVPLGSVQKPPSYSVDGSRPTG